MFSLPSAELQDQEELIRLGSWAMTKRYNYVVEAVLKTVYDRWGEDTGGRLNEQSFFKKYLPFYTIRNLLQKDSFDPTIYVRVKEEFDFIEASCKAEAGKENLEWNRIRIKIYERMGLAILGNFLELETTPEELNDFVIPEGFSFQVYSKSINEMFTTWSAGREWDTISKNVLSKVQSKLLDIQDSKVGDTKSVSSYNSVEKIFLLLTDRADLLDVTAFIDNVERKVFKYVPQITITEADRTGGQVRIKSVSQPTWTEEKKSTNGPYAMSTPNSYAASSAGSSSINYQKEYPNPKDPLHDISSSSAQPTTNGKESKAQSSSSKSNDTPIKPGATTPSSPMVEHAAKSNKSKSRRFDNEDHDNENENNSSSISKKNRTDSNENEIPVAVKISDLKDLAEDLVSNRPKRSIAPLSRLSETQAGEAQAGSKKSSSKSSGVASSPLPILAGINVQPEPRAEGQRIAWTAAEEEALLAGIEKYGRGNWALILSDPLFRIVLINRNSVNLKDKARNLSKK